MSDSFPLFGVMRWNSSELAEALLLSPQRVNQLSREHILPQAVDGLYTPVESVASYIRYLRQREAGKSVAGEGVKKLQLENSLREIKLRRIAGELVEVDRVKKDFFEMGRRVRDSLMNLPSRLSGPFAAECSQEKIFEMFTRDIYAVLSELSSRQTSEPITARLPLEESTQQEHEPDRGELDDSQPPAESTDSKFDEAFLDQGTDEDSEHRFADGD